MIEDALGCYTYAAIDRAVAEHPPAQGISNAPLKNQRLSHKPRDHLLTCRLLYGDRGEKLGFLFAGQRSGDFDGKPRRTLCRSASGEKIGDCSEFGSSIHGTRGCRIPLAGWQVV